MRYGTLARLLHWVVALLVLATIPVGLTMIQEGLARPVQDRLFIFHKNVGVILLLLIALRIVWRLLNPPPPLPASVPPLQRTAATVVHLGLYALLVVMAVSGYVRVTAGGFPIELLDALGVPPLIAENEPLAERAKAVHATAKFGLIVLIQVHILAAAYHGIVRRDGVFSRMWPPVASRP